MTASEREVYVKGVNVYQSSKAAIQNLGKAFQIILWKASFFNNVAG